MISEAYESGGRTLPTPGMRGQVGCMRRRRASVPTKDLGSETRTGSAASGGRFALASLAVLVLVLVLAAAGLASSSHAPAYIYWTNYGAAGKGGTIRSEEHTSELQSLRHL